VKCECKGDRLKGLVLNSGGIDSPVAVYTMAQHDLVSIHFDNYPYTSNTTPLTERITHRLERVLDRQVPLMTAWLGKSLTTFLEKSGREERKYTCIFCKRMMFRVAEKCARENHCQFLITGENLGQVASQTLQNIYVTSRAVTLPIIRPLIGLDKLDIIAIAEKIGTYEISIETASHCSAVPRYPAIRAQLKKIEELENRLNIQRLIEDAVSPPE